ncbi:MAG: glycosyltransferase, partial [Flavobacteriales bacterium]|nr:glycosyltransferase [Flavobacteriales bacterium]
MEQRRWIYTPLPEPVPITEQVWPEGTLPLVCTRTMAYMHERYIGKCLDGLLMQRTTFPVQVIVHDDASTDRTPDIIREYEAKYPHVLKVVYQTENSYTKPDRLERRAAVRALVDQGKYDAICEGDDYWTDPLKLQKQVQALEADPSVVGCFTDAWNEKNGERTSYMDGVYALRPTKRLLDQRDMVLGQNIPACTVVFRRSAWTTIPRSIAMGTIAGDTVRYVNITRKGPLLYLP